MITNTTTTEMLDEEELLRFRTIARLQGYRLYSIRGIKNGDGIVRKYECQIPVKEKLEVGDVLGEKNTKDEWKVIAFKLL